MGLNGGLCPMTTIIPRCGKDVQESVKEIGRGYWYVIT
jgi:hypothetical protein